MFESLAEKLKRMKSEEENEPQFKDYDEVVVEAPAPREEKVVIEEQIPVAKKPAAPKAPAAKPAAKKTANKSKSTKR